MNFHLFCQNAADRLKKCPQLVKDNKGKIAAALFLLLLYGIAYVVPRAAFAVSNVKAVSAKELPIYCVEREDKVAALTFDAAWVEGRLLE